MQLAPIIVGLRLRERSEAQLRARVFSLLKCKSSNTGEKQGIPILIACDNWEDSRVF